MFTGVQVLEPTVFDYMDTGMTAHKFSTTRETYPRMLSDGQPLYGFCFDGFWQDLGTADRIREAERSLAAGTRLHYL
jgi:NDP-sugar pyrophosphorylase family protein